MIESKQNNILEESSAIQVEEEQTSIEISGEQVRPWIRFWARMIDYNLYTMLLAIIALIVYPPAYKMSDLIFGMITLFTYTFIEAAMLSSWGTTPGKYFFKIRLRNKENRKLSYNEAVYRSWKVVFNGLGLGLPIISLFTLIHAFSALKTNKITSWDKDGEFNVSHQTIGLPRIIIVILIITFIIFIIVSEN